MASPLYTITDLGVGQAFAINENGQVAGLAGTTGFQAFSYLNGVKTIFGTSFGRSTSRAWGINESGVISGTFNGGVGGENNGDAFRWQSGSGSSIPFINGYGVNDQGTIVGDHINGNVVNAAIWSNGTVTDLGTLGGNSSRALDINNAGQVVGVARDASHDDHAFLWNGGALIPLSSHTSQAQDINEVGQIVGSNQFTNGTNHAALWQSGQIIDLDSLKTHDSIAYAINDFGTVVGYAGFAFIYQNGQAQFLDDLIDPQSGWQLRIGYDINNAGQIVGAGDFKGTTHAFLLTPISAPAAPMPPAVCQALLMVICMLLYLRFKWAANSNSASRP